MPGDSAELGSCDSCLWWNYMLSLPLGTNTRQLTSNLGTNTQNFPSQPFQEAWTLRSTHRVNSGALKAPDGLWCWHTTVLPGLWQSGLSGTIVSPRAARSRIIAFSNTRTTLHEFLKAFLQGWFCSCCLILNTILKVNWRDCWTKPFKALPKWQHGILSQKQHSQSHKQCR